MKCKTHSDVYSFHLKKTIKQMESLQLSPRARRGSILVSQGKIILVIIPSQPQQWNNHFSLSQYQDPLAMISIISLPFSLYIYTYTSACACAKSLQSCLTLCDPLNCSSPGSSVRETLPTRILEWVALPFSWGSSRPRDQTCISCNSCIADS